MHSVKYFQKFIDDELKKIPFNDGPAELYEPIRYMLNLGGKRLRPVLLLMSHELFSGEYEPVIGPALGIEVFHNFTLLHDDIMDKAPLRRSHQTVHTRWNSNIAILSGDTMFVKSCQLMMQCNDKFRLMVMDLFFRTAIEVCEGQQLDMNFESLPDVSVQDYIKMITLKTGVLLGCSVQMGAILAGADKVDSENMYDFGKNLGIAFQLLDDILDVYGDEHKFGKQVGGDILANKKTFLLLTALQEAGIEDNLELKRWISLERFDPKEKLDFIMNIYRELKVREKAEAEMGKYLKAALNAFNEIKITQSDKEPLLQLAGQLMVREY